ncbi:MAG: ATP-binding protein, partial [Myxococcales bacterium]|nr:ATP-binding protein [Myxococcales bacterium]
VLIEVADTGIGIAPDDISRIFERFYQVDASRSGGEGSGLGLAICRNILRHYSGDIHLQSQPGQGTCARVTLPQHTAAARSLSSRPNRRGHRPCTRFF